MDLASVTNELYAGSPDDFVERRKSLAGQARAAKDRALATEIGKLRKPTRSAWLVNLYAREAPGELGTLLDLGAALQAAQAQLSGPDLRRLSGERQKTLTAATRSAVALGEAQGYTATEAVRQEVTQTLQAALADPDVADQVRSGTVTEAHAYGGFGIPDLSAAIVAPTTTEADTSEDVSSDAEVERRADAEQQLREAEAALSTAAEEAEAATERADELADGVEALRAQLAEAEEAEAEARKLARAARKRVGELEDDVRAAREAYEAV